MTPSTRIGRETTIPLPPVPPDAAIISQVDINPIPRKSYESEGNNSYAAERL